MKKLIGIYKIQSILYPNRIYIGSAINIYQRWRHHISLLKANKHHSKKLQNHINKYGIYDIQFSIILFQCEKQDLVFLEQIFINNYKPYFNICKTANSQLGLKRSKSFCIHNGKLKIGNKNALNRVMSQEQKDKLRLFHLNSTQPQETKDKISKALKNKKKKPFTEQHKKNLSLAKIGNSYRSFEYKKSCH